LLLEVPEAVKTVETVSTVSTELHLSSAIRSIKEQLRRVPDKGLGYGVLKYINKDEKLSKHQSWDIIFNYLGQLDNVVSSGKQLSGAGESRGSSSDAEQPAGFKLSVNGMVQNAELILNWGYSSLHYNKETIEELVKNYKSALSSLIEHTIKQKENSVVVYTPSDYNLGEEITYQELDRFLEEPYKGKSRKESIEGLYRLSGLQQGMLFHALYDTRAGAYTEQLGCDLESPDLELVSRAGTMY
jgi:non-ribosomal peptide synthase protein (TIGR01720 family)